MTLVRLSLKTGASFGQQSSSWVSTPLSISTPVQFILLHVNSSKKPPDGHNYYRLHSAAGCYIIEYIILWGIIYVLA